MKLENHHEIIGTLSKVKTDEQYMKMEFLIHKAYEIPLGVISTEKLKSVVGKRIGIFNAGDGTFKLRKVKKK